MPLVFGDRVKETSTSVGLSSLSLDGAAPGFQSFAIGIGNGNQCFYTIESEADTTWEVGIGTVAGSSLSRDTILSSSNGGSAVNFAAGTKQVFATEAAQHFNSALNPTSHSALNHAGLPGIPAAEAFTSGVHATTSHTGLPGIPAPESFTSSAHDLTDHTLAPFNLLDADAHALINHTGIDGVGGSETYDQAAHNADDHTGVTGIAAPSQVEAESGVATVARLWTAERVGQAIAALGGLNKTALYFNATVGTITVPTGFTPILALFVGKYAGTTTTTIGYADGGTLFTQACSPSGALEAIQGYVIAQTGGGAVVIDGHRVTQFDATQVSATQVDGSAAWHGFVIVIG